MVLKYPNYVEKVGDEKNLLNYLLKLEEFKKNLAVHMLTAQAKKSLKYHLEDRARAFNS